MMSEQAIKEIADQSERFVKMMKVVSFAYDEGLIGEDHMRQVQEAMDAYNETLKLLNGLQERVLDLQKVFQGIDQDIVRLGVFDEVDNVLDSDLIGEE